MAVFEHLRKNKDRQQGSVASRARRVRWAAAARNSIGLGAVAAVTTEVILDDADMRQPEFVGFLREIERIAKVVSAGFLLGFDIGKNLHTEFMLLCSGNQRRVSARQKSNGRGGPDMSVIGPGAQLPCRCATQLSPKQACST